MSAPPLADRFIASQLYAIEGGHARRLHAIMLRLYTENRMDGDFMRDTAAAIRGILEFSAELGPLP